MRSLSSLGDPAIHPIRKIIDLVGNTQTGEMLHAMVVIMMGSEHQAWSLI